MIEGVYPVGKSRDKKVGQLKTKKDKKRAKQLRREKGSFQGRRQKRIEW
jgi:hypothetical protein